MSLRYFLILPFILLFANSPNAAAQDQDQTTLLVFMANGIYDPMLPPPTPLSGDFFDSEVMNRNAQEKAERQQQALDYFSQRFGVNIFLIDRTPVEGGDLVGLAIDPQQPTGINQSVVLMHGYQDQRWDYRAYVVDNQKVAEEGHPVRDASYNLVVNDPNGFTFYGEWGGVNGTFVPFATVVVSGEYLIEHPKKPRRNIHIQWESTDPIFDAFNPNGITFNCKMHSEKWGDGIALGRNFIKPVPGSTEVQSIIRNVLTFPAPISLQ